MDVHTGFWSLAVHVFCLPGCVADVEFEHNRFVHSNRSTLVQLQIATVPIYTTSTNQVELHWVELGGLLWIFIISVLAGNTTSLTCRNTASYVTYCIRPYSDLALKMASHFSISVLAMP